jgi:hypothetical protein
VLEERKAFFSEGKKQNTFNEHSRTQPAAHTQDQTFFGSFFKKDHFFSGRQHGNAQNI